MCNNRKLIKEKRRKEGHNTYAQLGKPSWSLVCDADKFIEWGMGRGVKGSVTRLDSPSFPRIDHTQPVTNGIALPLGDGPYFKNEYFVSFRSQSCTCLYCIVTYSTFVIAIEP